MNENQAILVRWLKQDGDYVHKDEPVCELESDKAAVVLPAWDSGILRHLAKAGEMIQIDQEFARIEPEQP
jgi:2-oxoglutarate dehydrogenase E2 component (dihydrolipoamide succinyltransferase)